MRSRLKWLALLSSVGMFLVLLMGALVTKTESGRGCGDDWPLCNGRFVPAYTIESLIEYSHRFVTGIEGLIVLAVFIGVWAYVRDRWDARVHSAGALFFTIVQAILGAMAVVWPQSPPVLALHFGVSLMAVASTFLLVLALWNWQGVKGERPGLGISYRPLPGEARISSGQKWLVWVVTIYCYCVVYLGAYVRHTDSSGGCSGWPLCNGEVIPELSGASGVAFLHRLGALLLIVLLIVLFYRLNGTHAGISRISVWGVLLGVLQILSGGLLVLSFGTDWYIFTSMLHSLLVTILFCILVYLCLAVYGLRKGEDR
ncbi:COX15/CtaA family protein [Paenibacillus sp. y28]|uniref:COX15/CtaA family protein n=1 Tax=Paenibacillus sp. y28 TaxID=3129110 RepID=UPI003017D377